MASSYRLSIYHTPFPMSNRPLISTRTPLYSQKCRQQQQKRYRVFKYCTSTKRGERIKGKMERNRDRR